MIFCPETKKHCHTAKSKAVAQMRSLQQRFGYTGKVYFCQHCNCWHVGRDRNNARQNKYRKEKKA